MDTLNDLDFTFLLIDILVIAAGFFAVGAWYFDHRRQTVRERARGRVAWQGE